MAYITGQCQQTVENVVHWWAKFNSICIFHRTAMGLIQGTIIELYTLSNDSTKLGNSANLTIKNRQSSSKDASDIHHVRYKNSTLQKHVIKISKLGMIKQFWDLHLKGFPIFHSWHVHVPLLLPILESTQQKTKTENIIET